MMPGEVCRVCGYAYAAQCRRCASRITADNRLLNDTGYGCEHCQGKRPELIKTLGQEDEAHQYEKSKAESA